MPVRSTAGPVLEKPGDLAAILTNLKAREVLFIDEIHGMSPAIEEILYPGARGLRARSRDRPGARRALGQGAAAAVHAGRRDDAHRPADGAAAQPLRHRPSPRLLRRGRHGRDRARGRRGSSACRSTTPRRASCRAGPAARRASPTGCCGASATTRRCAPTARSPWTSRDAALAHARSRRRTGSTRSIDACCGRSSTSSAAGRSGSTPSPPRSARSPTRSRTSTSRS